MRLTIRFFFGAAATDVGATRVRDFGDTLTFILGVAVVGRVGVATTVKAHVGRR
jgi:hypothetical protein